MTHSQTPGGRRLRTLRAYYGQTQLDIELDASLGIGYLQRLESGRVRQPERDTLDRILAALGARYTERRDVLELFGYIVDAPVPDADEIAWAVAACRAELDGAVFPAYLLDCAHRLLGWNTFVPDMLGIDPQVGPGQISILQHIFDTAHGLAQIIANPDDFFPAQIRALRYEMQWFHDEPWYSALIEEMRRCCPTFARYWGESNGPIHIPARPLTPMELRIKTGECLKFRLISEPFVQDHRFRVIYCLPADADTNQHCLDWSQQATSAAQESG
jgi:transcriptional regulator with XRE-family HTH domain